MENDCKKEAASFSLHKELVEMLKMTNLQQRHYEKGNLVSTDLKAAKDDAASVKLTDISVPGAEHVVISGIKKKIADLRWSGNAPSIDCSLLYSDQSENVNKIWEEELRSAEPELEGQISQFSKLTKMIVGGDTDVVTIPDVTAGNPLVKPMAKPGPAKP